MRKVKIARALTRPALIAGCERTPLIALGMVCTIMGITTNLYLMIGAICLCVVGIGVLRRMAKHDPIMIKIYLRHIKFKKFYMSKPTIQRFL